jgi:predicted secreted protein
MTLGIPTSLAIYLTIWWTVLFAVLPIGVTSHAEAGIDKGDGGDPGAPVDPKLKKKFITTTWISAVIFALFWLALRFNLIHLPSLPGQVH